MGAQEKIALYGTASAKMSQNKLQKNCKEETCFKGTCQQALPLSHSWMGPDLVLPPCGWGDGPVTHLRPICPMQPLNMLTSSHKALAVHPFLARSLLSMGTVLEPAVLCRYGSGAQLGTAVFPTNTCWSCLWGGGPLSPGGVVS